MSRYKHIRFYKIFNSLKNVYILNLYKTLCCVSYEFIAEIFSFWISEMLILIVIEEALQDIFKGMVHILTEIDGKKCIAFIE